MAALQPPEDLPPADLAVARLIGWVTSAAPVARLIGWVTQAAPGVAPVAGPPAG